MRKPNYRIHVSEGTVTVYGTGQAEVPYMTEHEAGVRLLAAPDLLAACQGLLALVGAKEPQYMFDVELTDVVVKARAAVAKAGGKE